MGTLRGIVAKVFVVILFSMLILSFAVWGIGDIFRGQANRAPVVEIGDITISQEEFRQAYVGDLSRLQRGFGGQLDPQMAISLGLPQQTLARLVSQALISEEAGQLRLTATDTQVREKIQSTPGFQNQAGKFDRFRFDQALRNAQMNEAMYIAATRQDLVRQQLVDALTSGAKTPRVLAESLYSYRNETRVADYVNIATAGITDIPEASEDDLKSFYEGSKNDFLAPEYRAVTYTLLTPDLFQQEGPVTDEELQEEYNAHITQYDLPERRNVVQALFANEDEAKAAAKLITEGKSLEEAAKEVNGGTTIDLGLQTEAGLSGDLGVAAFGLDEGDISAPVQSPFGWHLLTVTKIEPAHTRSIDEVRDELTASVKTRKAVDSLISVANNLDDVLASGATLEEAASELGLTLNSIKAVDEAGLDRSGTAVSNLPDTPEFLETAYATEAGNQSLLTEDANGNYFVLRVDSIIPAAPRPFEKVREIVLSNWQAQERNTAAFAKADALAAKLREGQTLASVAKDAGLTVLKTAPLTRFSQKPSLQLSQSLFSLKPGDVDVVDGPAGPIVAILKNVTAAADNAEEIAELQEQARTSTASELLDVYLQSIESRLGTKVNETALNQVLETF